jgi:hypothetical protein
VPGSYARWGYVNCTSFLKPKVVGDYSVFKARLTPGFYFCLKKIQNVIKFRKRR